MAAAALIGCSDSSSTPTASGASTAASTDGSASGAMQLIGELRRAGLPITSTVERSPEDDAYREYEELVSKVDFRDGRLLSTSQKIDEDFDGGSVEVYRDERAAVAGLRDRCGYTFQYGAVVVHLASAFAPEWALEYRHALPRVASSAQVTTGPPATTVKPKRAPARYPGCPDT